MTTQHPHHTDDPDHNRDDDHRMPADPLRPDRLRCPCGATADRDGLCRKCRARALYGRRTASRRTHADRPPTRRHGAPPATSRPRNRQPGR
jgi:hypothetical protein